ncbi:hypothetical protein [Bacillus phage vB_BceS-M2]
MSLRARRSLLTVTLHFCYRSGACNVTFHFVRIFYLL